MGFLLYPVKVDLWKEQQLSYPHHLKASLVLHLDFLAPFPSTQYFFPGIIKTGTSVAFVWGCKDY